MNGVDLMTVRELMGHKDIEMTLRYAHLSCNHKVRAVEALSEKIDTIWTPKSQGAAVIENKDLEPVENKEISHSGEVADNETWIF